MADTPQPLTPEEEAELRADPTLFRSCHVAQVWTTLDRDRETAKSLGERIAALEGALLTVQETAIRGEREHSYQRPAGQFFREIATTARTALDTPEEPRHEG